MERIKKNILSSNINIQGRLLGENYKLNAWLYMFYYYQRNCKYDKIKNRRGGLFQNLIILVQKVMYKIISMDSVNVTLNVYIILYTNTTININIESDYKHIFARLFCEEK